MGRVNMGRMIWIVGLVYALCALAAGSFRPEQWSALAQAVMMVIVGSTILMTIESDIARNTRRARPAAGSAARFRPAA